MINTKTVTLYIDDTGIRLLETRGKQIKKWAEVPLEPGLVKSAVIVNGLEVSAKIKQLFKAQKMKAKKVVVGFSGLHSLTRPIMLPLLPKNMQAEAVIREAKRVLPLPLEQLYLSWQSIPAPAGKIQVFLVAIPRKTADALVKTLREAGLEPSHMTLKPMALTRALTEKAAILLDVQTSEFDIMIVSEGVAHPIRTISLPTESVSWQEKLPLIVSDVDRTIKFYNSNSKEKTLDSDVPVYISGELMNMPDLQKVLADVLGRNILPLPSPLEIPSQLDQSRYMTNINLALREPGKGVLPSISKLNVLPVPYQPRPISLNRIIVAPGTAMTVLLIAPLIMLTQTSTSNTASLSDQMVTVNKMIVQKQQELGQLNKNIAELEKNTAKAKTTETNLKAALNAISQRQREVYDNLKLTVNTASDSISLLNVTHSAGMLTISGSAAGDAEILNFATRLDTSRRFSEIVVASIKRTTSGELNFTLILKMKE